MNMKPYIYVIVVVAIIAVIGYFFLFSTPSSAMPAYATKHPLIKEAYTFAQENEGDLEGVNCYCGCMMHVHEGRIHSRGLADCFRTPEGGWERHGSDCSMCINDALSVKEMAAEGKSKEEIKSFIDAKYAGSGHG